MESPRRNLPTAARRYFYRLIIFYIGCVLAIGILAPYNAPALTDGGAGAGSSGFVVGITHAGIPVLSSIINAGRHPQDLSYASTNREQVSSSLLGRPAIRSCISRLDRCTLWR